MSSGLRVSLLSAFRQSSFLSLHPPLESRESVERKIVTFEVSKETLPSLRENESSHKIIVFLYKNVWVANFSWFHFSKIFEMKTKITSIKVLFVFT